MDLDMVVDGLSNGILRIGLKNIIFVIHTVL